MSQLYYDRQGQPMSREQWAVAFEDFPGRRIGETTLPSGVRISTVWMGLDHQFGEGPPLIFKTMAFSPKGEELDCERYTTEDAARDGHEHMVTQWSRKP